MWYETLPIAGIIAACFVVPQLVSYYTEKAIHGNPLRRSYFTSWNTIMTERDVALTGSYRKPRGLEGIPDK